jgi:hypothetical protein
MVSTAALAVLADNVACTLAAEPSLLFASERNRRDEAPHSSWDLLHNRPLDKASHQGLGDSPDATLLHKTLPLARSSNRLELNSQAELNLPGSSSGDEAINYSEAAPSEGCPW